MEYDGISRVGGREDRLCFFGHIRLAASMRPAGLNFLWTSREAEFYLHAIKLLHTKVRAGFSICIGMHVSCVPRV